jgi:hypothetical protein
MFQSDDSGVYRIEGCALVSSLVKDDRSQTKLVEVDLRRSVTEIRRGQKHEYRYAKNKNNFTACGSHRTSFHG